MNAGLQIRELASLIGVPEDTVLNWELRGMTPLRRDVRERVNYFLEIQ